MPDPPHDSAIAPGPAGPRPFQAGRTVHAFGRAFAATGTLCAAALAVLLPAFLFRADAAGDMRALVAGAFAVTWLSGFAGAAWAQAFPERRARRRTWSRERVRLWRLRQLVARGRLVGLLLVPFVAYVACAHLRGWLVERRDPLYVWCERGLCRALAQPGIAAPTSLAVVEGRLTLAVPAWPARRAHWWVDVDADDTLGRRCTFHRAVLFGDDPAVLHIPLPLASDELPTRPFGLAPGSMVVVRGVRLTLADSAAGSRAARFERRLQMVYEVPPARGGRERALTDFVNHQGI